MITPVCAETGSAGSTKQVPVELLRALNAALAAVPTAFRNHHKALDAFACTLLALPNLSIEQRREAAHCYALLAKVKGEHRSLCYTLAGCLPTFAADPYGQALPVTMN